tara:strand:- start:1764 stop:2135 length:372 start_codon:yes stop_codon:yes gene_type:complete
MNAKEYIAKGYELFAKGDMVAYFDTIDDDIVFTLPGDSHPFSGVYKGKKAMMEVLAKIPGSWNNFSVEPEFMISEGNKVFVKVIAKADGMNTIFGHYFEVNDEGKTIVFTAHDDTLSSKNAMI